MKRRGAPKSQKVAKHAEAPAGSQSICRAVAVLRAVASGREQGRRLTEVAGMLNLNVATAHRILGTLVHERLLVHHTDSKAYRIGPDMISMAAIASSQFALRDLLHDAMAVIAAKTQDTVFLQMSSGDETVCVARTTGTFAIPALVLDVGTRLALGLGSAGLAMLAYMSEAECEAVIQRCAAEYKKHDISADTVRNSVKRARSLGYSFQEGRLTREIAGLSVLLVDDHGIAAAISLTALSQRLRPVRRRQIVSIIRDACAGVPGVRVYPSVLPRERESRRTATRAKPRKSSM